MVYYRKYRPQTIDELDSASLREKLNSVFLHSFKEDKKKQLVIQDNIPHAFLFTGPKGLGKTSTARIIAKVINCERPVSQRLASSSQNEKLNAERSTLDADIEPCNVCATCISITKGTNMDILEIDGASNR